MQWYFTLDTSYYIKTFYNDLCLFKEKNQKKIK